MPDNRFVDYTGQTIGIWKFLEPSGRRGQHRMWLIQCINCGDTRKNQLHKRQ
jgi:hypothetical protein